MAYAQHRKGAGMRSTGERQKVELITDRLFENIAKVKFGSVSVTLRVHSGRIVDVTYSTTESMKETGSQEAKGSRL